MAIEKESVQLDLEVVPNSKQFKIAGKNPWTGSLRVKVRGKALKGEANKELLLELERLFNAKTELISGEKSRKKRVLLKGISEEEAAKRLQEQT